MWLLSLERTLEGTLSWTAHVECSFEYYGFRQTKENLGFTEKLILNQSEKAYFIFTEEA